MSCWILPWTWFYLLSLIFISLSVTIWFWYFLPHVKWYIQYEWFSRVISFYNLFFILELPYFLPWHCCQMYMCTRRCQTNQAYVDRQFWEFLYFPFTLVHICFSFVNSKCTFFHVTRDTKNVSSPLWPPRLSYVLCSDRGIGNVGLGLSLVIKQKQNLISIYQNLSHAHPLNSFQFIMSVLIVSCYRWQKDK